MNDENLKPVEKLTPFTKMIMTIGTLPSSFYASMSYYESMVWLYEYLKNEVIPTVNNNAEACEELQEKFIELNQDEKDFKEYIDGKVEELETYMNNYFDNLDVQQEINNKLDAMALDGTLTNLIKAYVDPIYEAYETEINQIVENQNTEIVNFKTAINSQMTILENEVESAVSGSPKGVYATLSDLQTADPNHDYIYVVNADGHWYYYNTSQSGWADGGIYQASVNLDSVESLRKDVDTIVADINTLYDLIDTDTFIDGKYINYDSGYEGNNASWSASDYIEIEAETTYILECIGNSQGALYDSTKTFIADSGIRIEPNSAIYTKEEITTPATAKYLRISAATSRIDELHIHKKGKPILNKEIEIPQLDMVDKAITNKDVLYDLIDHSDLTNGGYIVHDSGYVVSLEGWTYTDYYIEIDPTKSYTLEYKGPIHGAYYNEHKVYDNDGILIEVLSTIEGSQVLTIPNTSKYIRLSCKTANTDYMILHITGQATLNESIGVKASQIINDENNLNIIKYTELDVGTGKTYTTLREAFAQCISPSYYNRYIVNFYGDGTEYDISSEFTIEELANENFIGRRVPEWTKLRGIGGKEKCIIGLRLTENTSSEKISTLNTYGSSELEDLTIIGDYTRYAVHDDYMTINAKRIWKNCHFETIHTTYKATVGAGSKSGDIMIFENCVFKANEWATRPYSCHNNTGFINPVNLYFINCRFINTFNPETNTSRVELSSLNTNANGIINNAFFYGCYINKLELDENNVGLYGAGILWKVSGYGNNLKTNDVVITHTDEKDYSGYVDLI